MSSSKCTCISEDQKQCSCIMTFNQNPHYNTMETFLSNNKEQPLWWCCILEWCKGRSEHRYRESLEGSCIKKEWTNSEITRRSISPLVVIKDSKATILYVFLFFHMYHTVLCTYQWCIVQHIAILITDCTAKIINMEVRSVNHFTHMDTPSGYS